MASWVVQSLEEERFVLKRSTFMKLSAMLLTGTLALAGCGVSSPSGAPEEKRLTLYTSFSPDLTAPMAEAFEQHSGIKVDLVDAGTGEMLGRIDAEKQNPQGDVMLGGGAESFEAFRENFESYKVKDEALIPARYKAPDHRWHAYVSLPVVLIYNTNLVSEAEKPAGWQDLVAPQWKGRVAMADANKSGTSFVQVATMLTLFGRDNGEGWQMIEDVVANAKVLGSSSMPLKGVNDGEYAIGLTYEYGAYKYKKAGGPIGVIYPAEGTVSLADAVAIIKGAPHPQNARLFMDWLFSQEGQELATSMGLRPVREGVSSPAGLLPSSEIKLIDLDQSWVAENRAEILSQWKDIVTR
jgi:iron(III) transport system substrate-binding protein